MVRERERETDRQTEREKMEREMRKKKKKMKKRDRERKKEREGERDVRLLNLHFSIIIRVLSSMREIELLGQYGRQRERMTEMNLSLSLLSLSHLIPIVLSLAVF